MFESDLPTCFTPADASVIAKWLCEHYEFVPEPDSKVLASDMRNKLVDDCMHKLSSKLRLALISPIAQQPIRAFLFLLKAAWPVGKAFEHGNYWGRELDELYPGRNAQGAGDVLWYTAVAGVVPKSKSALDADRLRGNGSVLSTWSLDDDTFSNLPPVPSSPSAGTASPPPPPDVSAPSDVAATATVQPATEPLLVRAGNETGNNERPDAAAAEASVSVSTQTAQDATVAPLPAPASGDNESASASMPGATTSTPATGMSVSAMQQAACDWAACEIDQMINSVTGNSADTLLGEALVAASVLFVRELVQTHNITQLRDLMTSLKARSVVCLQDFDASRLAIKQALAKGASPSDEMLDAAIDTGSDLRDVRAHIALVNASLDDCDALLAETTIAMASLQRLGVIVGLDGCGGAAITDADYVLPEQETRAALARARCVINTKPTPVLSTIGVLLRTIEKFNAKRARGDGDSFSGSDDDNAGEPTQQQQPPRKRQCV